jgi:hypothetical protein
VGNVNSDDVKPFKILTAVSKNIFLLGRYVVYFGRYHKTETSVPRRMHQIIRRNTVDDSNVLFHSACTETASMF